MLEFRRFALPPRYRVLVWVVGLFVAINAAVRLGLLIFEGDAANLVALASGAGCNRWPPL